MKTTDWRRIWQMDIAGLGCRQKILPTIVGSSTDSENRRRW